MYKDFEDNKIHNPDPRDSLTISLCSVKHNARCRENKCKKMLRLSQSRSICAINAPSNKVDLFPIVRKEYESDIIDIIYELRKSTMYAVMHSTI